MPRFVTEFPPIKLDYFPKTLRAGKTNLLKMMLEIPQGFDIMAHIPQEEFLIPAELILESSEGIAFGEPSYPEAIEQKFEWSEIVLRVYKGRFEVNMPIEIAHGKSGKIEIIGKVSFQGCTENQCLPPKKQDFKLVFDIVEEDR